ncbi:MAG: flavin monoamine oxidase family protein [Myxococcota bacterium]
MSSKGLTRRDLLRLAASATATAIASAPRPSRATPSHPVRVVVVGAGLAGLVTARELVRAGVDPVVVLEARDRVGGRTLNLPLPGGAVAEGGGEWVGPTQTHVTDLARDLGIATFKSYYEGDALYELDGALRRSHDPPLGIAESLDYLLTSFRLDRLARSVPLDRPWAAPDASRLDRMTLGDWVHAHGWTASTERIFDLIARSALGGRADRVSLLWFLFFLHSGGGVAPIADTEGGAQDSRFVGGSQRISIRLAEELGERVVLSSPVRRIVDRGEGTEAVQIESDRSQLEAERVVVAMMPADTLRIDFVPELPLQRRELVHGWLLAPHSRALKLAAVYPEPFWRAEGLSGLLLGNRPPLEFVFDNSPPEGRPGVLGAIVAADELGPLGAVARRERVVDLLGRTFGENARHPIFYTEKDWALDPWSTGCVSPLPPGLLTRAGPALRAPVGRIHWAGTETAEVWNGYMDGAVRSGERAAREVQAQLAKAQTG